MIMVLKWGLIRKSNFINIKHVHRNCRCKNITAKSVFKYERVTNVVATFSKHELSYNGCPTQLLCMSVTE